MAPRTETAIPIPKAPITRLTRPLVHFLEIESASGFVLLICVIVALAMANSPAAEWWEKLWHTPMFLTIGRFQLGGELGHFVVNDVLMTIFFFLVGLEIKRELVAGELRDPRKAALPVAAAIGGMIAPAAIYLALQQGQPGERGWGIPMATDIAFVVGVMALLGKRAPSGLKVMLLSLAIADDIGAVVVIALFYSSGLDWQMLGAAGFGFVITYALNRGGVRSVPIYTLIGIITWYAMLKSGIHPTIAGVILGLMTPSVAWLRPSALRDAALPFFQNDSSPHPADLKVLAFAVRETVSPLERLEMALHPWVGFVIMPLFALANAGVEVHPSELTSPVALAVALGLFLGKPLGIVAFSWLAVQLRVGLLPHGVTWWSLLGGGCLAGIGFTMSLFVAGLALEGEMLAAGKIGTLAGSTLSAMTGIIVLMLVGKPKPDAANGTGSLFEN